MGHLTGQHQRCCRLSPLHEGSLLASLRLPVGMCLWECGRLVCETTRVVAHSSLKTHCRTPPVAQLPSYIKHLEEVMIDILVAHVHACRCVEGRS